MYAYEFPVEGQQLSVVDFEVLRVVRDRDQFYFEITKQQCGQALFNLWQMGLIDMEYQGDEDSGGLEPTGITPAGLTMLESY